jgi:hypothetical protein
VEIFLFENDETILRSGPLDKQSIIDKEKIIRMIALWEWYGGPLFRTEEAAVMFKLGFIEL